jgi:hypothetical protein
MYLATPILLCVCYIFIRKCNMVEKYSQLDNHGDGHHQPDDEPIVRPMQEDGCANSQPNKIAFLFFLQLQKTIMLFLTS